MGDCTLSVVDASVGTADGVLAGADEGVLSGVDDGVLSGVEDGVSAGVLDGELIGELEDSDGEDEEAATVELSGVEAGWLGVLADALGVED